MTLEDNLKDVEYVQKLNDFRQLVRIGNLKKIQAAIDNGYDVNSLGWGGTNALRDALTHNTIVLLVKNGIDVENVDENTNQTILHLECYTGNNSAQTVKLLLNSGVDPTIKDTHGNTALDYAYKLARGGNEEWRKEYLDKAKVIEKFIKEKG